MRLPGSARTADAPTVAFFAYLVVALPILLLTTPDRWFLADEWSYLADRSATDLGDLFSPHNQHWSTLPILVYRVLFSVVGIRTYVPYQLVVIVLHLVACALLWHVMRRAGVRPWIASCAAAMFVLFGPGGDNIIWAFQMAWSGALVLGLTQLVLADHDGPIDRRDWLGLLAGAGALMSAGIAPTLVVAVGVATLVRRGWRVAAFHTAPLAVMYLTWYIAHDVGGDGALVIGGAQPGMPTPGIVLDWVRTSQRGVLKALGHQPIVTLGLVAVLLLGLALAWGPVDGATRRRSIALPGALLVGALLFQAASSTSRWFLDDALASRYLHVGAALVLPALAVAADALVARWRYTGPVVAVLLLVPIPLNSREFADQSAAFDYERQRNWFRIVSESDVLDQVPGWVRPDPGVFVLGEVDVAWLREARRTGRLPQGPPTPDPQAVALLPIQFGLGQVREELPVDAECTTHRAPVDLTTEVGDELLLGSKLQVVRIEDREPVSPPRTLEPVNGASVRVELPDLTIRLEPASGRTRFTLCERAG